MDRSIEEAQRRLASQLMSQKGVTGVAIGADDGRPCLRVYVSGPTLHLPSRFDGYPVMIVGGGPFRALDGDPGPGR